MRTTQKSMPTVAPPFRPTVQAPQSKSGAQGRLDIAQLAPALRLFRDGDAKKASAQCWRIIAPLLAGDARPKKKPSKDEQAYIYFVLAQAFFAEQDYQSVKTAVSRAIALNKSNVQAVVLLARALERLDDIDGSLEAAHKAIAMAPDVLDGHEALADTLLEAGYTERALSTAKHAATVMAHAPGAHMFLARILRHLCDNEGALAAYTQALRAGVPNPTNVLTNIGHILHDLGKPDDALSHYTQALAANPKMLEAWHGRVNTLMTAGRQDEAKTLYRQACETVPGYQNRYFDFLHPLFDPPLPEREVLTAQDVDSKQVVLVNALATFPSLPLGPALIKSNIEKNSDFRVRCMDLNTAWYTAVMDALRNRTGAFHFEDSERCVEAADLFNSGGDAFFDDASHNPLAETFARYRTLISDAYNDQCQKIFETNGPTPWYIEHFARHILAHKPRVVALSVMFTHQFWSAALLARAVKAIAPNVITVFGGGFFNEVNLQSFITRNFVDHVIVHEGELAFLELLRAIETDDGGYAMVTGLARFNDETGATDIGKSLEKLNHEELPFADFSDFDLDAYYTPEPVVPLISSRGCYWRRCTFCDHFASYAGTYKTQSISRCVAEIEHHVKTIGARHFTFVDEMISAKRFKKIGEEIQERALDIRYFALAKPTPDFTQEILDFMYETGCRCIYWGLEAGSERLLALMDKGNTVESSSNTLRRATKANIRNHLFLIVGFPSETREELNETVKFIYDHADNADKILANGYVLKRGTPIHDQMETFGIKTIYKQRALCNSKILKYEAATGLGAGITHPMAEYLQVEVFDRISPRGTFFGTPRNQIIIVYGKDDLPKMERTKKVPSYDDVMKQLDAITPDSKFLPNQSMVPIWNV